MLLFRWRKPLLFIADLVLFYSALGLALVARRFTSVPLDFYLEHARVFSVFIPVWASVFYIVGFYDTRRMNRLVNLINSSLVGFALNLAAASALFYAFYLQLGLTPKTHLFLTILFLHILATVWRRIWTRAVLPNLLVQKVAFLGSNSLVEEMKADLRRHPYLGFSVAELPELPKECRGGGGYWKPGRKSCSLSGVIDVLVVNAEEAEKNPLVESLLFSTAVLEEIPIITHLDFYEDLYGKIPPEHAAKPTWLLSNVLHKDNRFYAFIKRGLDVLLALIGLIITLPVSLIIYLALKSAHGFSVPAFFIQKRVGYLGKRFVIWKFRTMVIGAQNAGPLYRAGGRDSRVTRLGRFLRGTRLDEIPQLWNVLKGDMSLVGPRPEWVREVRILEGTVPHYHLRHLVKPGATGWAQINYHATSSAEESMEKLHYDLYYVKNMSLALDLGIILRTFRRIFQKDSLMAARMAAQP